MVIGVTSPAQPQAPTTATATGTRQRAPQASSGHEVMLPHFVLLQHGVHGRAHDLRLLKALLNASTGCRLSGGEGPSSHFAVFDTDINWGLNTHRGVDVCADKLWDVLRPALLDFLVYIDAAPQQYAGAGRALFSCVGHSFGGILCREIAARIVDDAQLSPRFGLGIFVSVATPHLGVRLQSNPIKGIFGKLFGATVSSTVQQLRLEAPPGANALVESLVDGRHVAALRGFSRRILVAAVNNDVLVPYASATLQVELPAEQLRGTQDEPRQTEHTLAIRLLRGASDPASLGPLRAHVASLPDPAAPGATEARLALLLREAMDFEVLPLVSDAWYPNAHSAAVSKRGWTESQRMDDVSVVIAQLLGAAAI